MLRFLPLSHPPAFSLLIVLCPALSQCSCFLCSCLFSAFLNPAYDKASEIVLLDDSRSAVDAHVGHHLLHNCILSGPLSNRTRVLVTHHLDVLPRADLVLVMDRDGQNEGRIIQAGTYAVRFIPALLDR